MIERIVTMATDTKERERERENSRGGGNRVLAFIGFQAASRIQDMFAVNVPQNSTSLQHTSILPAPTAKSPN